MIIVLGHLPRKNTKMFWFQLLKYEYFMVSLVFFEYLCVCLLEQNKTFEDVNLNFGTFYRPSD